jgi:hypothetical protein
MVCSDVLTRVTMLVNMVEGRGQQGSRQDQSQPQGCDAAQHVD